MSPAKYRGEIILVSVALIWGSGFVASDLALGALTASYVLSLRFIIGAIVMAVIFRRELRQATRLTIRSGLTLGIILYVSFFAQTLGLVYTTPAKNAFLTSVNVIIVPFIGLILYRRPVDRTGVVGAFLAVAGVGLISFNFDGSINVGDLLTLLCAVGFAFHIYYTGELIRRGAEAIALTTIQLATAAVLSIPIAMADMSMQIGTVKGGQPMIVSLVAAIYLGVLSTALAFLLQSVGQQWTNQTRAAIILSTESVFGALLSTWLLKEQLTVRTIIGSAIVFLAILVAEGSFNWRKKEPFNSIV
ncbi:MAG: DMT family transporter [Eubacteriales bacterium]|nr:DMT family transporter [Eubacteriales bacterium]